MIKLINRATRRLDVWALRYPARTALCMALLAVVVCIVANHAGVETPLSVGVASR